MLASARSEAKRGTFWLSLLIGVDPINAVFFTSVAGVLVGAFFGFYAAKRRPGAAHVARRARRLMAITSSSAF